jgi:hypothetical protein
MKTNEYLISFVRELYSDAKKGLEEEVNKPQQAGFTLKVPEYGPFGLQNGKAPS